MVATTKPCPKGDIEPERTVDFTSQRTVTTALAEVVCNHKGIDPLESGFSLYEHLDTEALDTLVNSVTDELHLQFSIDDINVCIWAPNTETVHIYVKNRQ